MRHPMRALRRITGRHPVWALWRTLMRHPKRALRRIIVRHPNLPCERVVHAKGRRSDAATETAGLDRLGAGEGGLAETLGHSTPAPCSAARRLFSARLTLAAAAAAAAAASGAFSQRLASPTVCEMCG